MAPLPSMMAGAAGSAPAATGPTPKLPAIVGACPEFKDGTTIMVAGHKSILIRAGAPNKGGALLFYWHGTGSSASESTRFPAIAEIVDAGGIVAAFNGSGSAKADADCSGTDAHNSADFKAADQIAACAVEKHGIDPRRIYSTGCSSGALQSGCMAELRSSYIAAVATNSGGLNDQPRKFDWQDEHTPAVLTMHGGDTDMVILSFSQTSALLDMRAKEHGSYVVNCNHGGGHCQAPAELQRAAWQFMQDHPFGGESPWKSGFPAGTPAYCKAY